MCVTNVYVDLYPDGRRQEFRQTSICQYALPGRPCARLSTTENPVRKIQWGEPTTEFMLTQHQRVFPATLPNTPPRSSGGSHHRRSGASNHRLSGGYTSAEEAPRRRSSVHNHRPEPIRRATREHRKERIVIVESPPTPRTPPQAFRQTFTAPNSPATRGRPIIVDERPRPPPRVPSVGAVIGDRLPRRSHSSSGRSFVWDSPSSSHTSFDLHTRADELAAAAAAAAADQRRRDERDQRIAELESERRRASFIAAQDEEIRNRPAVPLMPLSPPPRLSNRPFLRPVVDQERERERERDRERDRALQNLMGGLRLDDRVLAAETESRRREEDRQTAFRLRVEAQEQEALKQRLRERQLPRRRFSVGPAQRRHRVLYDDGVYRWE